MSNKRGSVNKFPHNGKLCKNYSNLLWKDIYDIIFKGKINTEKQDVLFDPYEIVLQVKSG